MRVPAGIRYRESGWAETAKPDKSKKIAGSKCRPTADISNINHLRRESPGHKTAAAVANNGHFVRAGLMQLESERMREWMICRLLQDRMAAAFAVIGGLSESLSVVVVEDQVLALVADSGRDP